MVVTIRFEEGAGGESRGIVGLVELVAGAEVTEVIAKKVGDEMGRSFERALLAEVCLRSGHLFDKAGVTLCVVCRQFITEASSGGEAGDE